MRRIDALAVVEFLRDLDRCRTNEGRGSEAAVTKFIDSTTEIETVECNSPKNSSGFGLDTNSLMYLLRELFIAGEDAQASGFPSYAMFNAYTELEKAAKDTVMNYPHIPPRAKK